MPLNNYYTFHFHFVIDYYLEAVIGIIKKCRKRQNLKQMDKWIQLSKRQRKPNGPIYVTTNVGRDPWLAPRCNMAFHKKHAI